MKRRATGLTVIAGLLAAASVLVALPSTALGSATRGSASASNSQTFADSTGENPAAPDITSITVSNDDAGNITFQVNIPNRPALTPDMLLVLYVDADNKASTGDPQAFGIGLPDPARGGRGRPVPVGGNGLTGTSVATPSLIYSYGPAGATIHVSASDLGKIEGVQLRGPVRSRGSRSTRPATRTSRTPSTTSPRTAATASSSTTS